MAKNCIQLFPDIDWITHIMEVQTSPDINQSIGSCTVLYEEVFCYLLVTARKWLYLKGYSEAHDIELASVGLSKVFRDIHKFDLNSDDSVQVIKSFKVWVGICSEREWIKKIDIELNLAKDVSEDTDLLPVLSIEDMLIEAETERPDNEKILKRKILREELDAVVPDMRDAILETEALKRVGSPNGRGLQGDSQAIADKYSFSQGSIRTCKSRLVRRVKDRFMRESKQ